MLYILNDLLKLEKKFFSQRSGFTNDDYTGIPQAVEIMENLEESRKKLHAWKNHGI